VRNLRAGQYSVNVTMVTGRPEAPTSCLTRVWHVPLICAPRGPGIEQRVRARLLGKIPKRPSVCIRAIALSAGVDGTVPGIGGPLVG
jgi:hypothetical protein